MANEHKTVLLSMLATVLAGGLLFLVTVVSAGGISITLFKAYVLPFLMSAFTLSIFWVFLFVRHKGKLPVFDEAEPATEE
ncbi:MAG: hypothetical protein OK449_01020 [Thaumarchaeota archaeon]|nr:hypothetical protein [Nitrososphaerota archaeon]